MASLNRIWAMPNHRTFQIKPIQELIRKYLVSGEVWIDPFCGDSPFNDHCIHGDLREGIEALALLSQQSDESCDGILFDPPYSPRQISECYKGVGRQVHKEDTQISFYAERKNEATRILKCGGIAICFGWNSNGFGMSRGFELLEVLLVPHGSAHNDTICTVERKVKKCPHQVG